jgi:uncharacterized protein YjbI with pentapeptide repeats
VRPEDVVNLTFHEFFRAAAVSAPANAMISSDSARFAFALALLIVAEIVLVMGLWQAPLVPLQPFSVGSTFGGQVEAPWEPFCEGPYKDRQPTPDELAEVLREHQAWLESKEPRNPNDPRRANLCRANLHKANLIKANLQKALLYRVRLQEATLVDVDLQHAFMHGANLQGAGIGRVDFQSAKLSNADLQKVFTWRADFRHADLTGADLKGAQLLASDFRHANMGNANMENVNLIGAALEDASMNGATLAGAIFEPYSLPTLIFVAHASNLEKMRFVNSPIALVELREAFKKAGMRTQERQITYAIEHTRTEKAWNPAWPDPRKRDERPWLEKLWGKIEWLFKLLAFELTSDYGMSYGRPLKILAVSIGLFALVYIVALLTARGQAGIWAIWPADRIYKAEGEIAEGQPSSSSRVTSRFIFPRLQAQAAEHWWGALLRALCVPLLGLYFSIISAFSLGWRELNVGTWIARMQPREYTLRATGWVRMVSGIQSLLSVYLLALWVLTYFGRPFE